MRLATVHCSNPNCSPHGTIWETVLAPGEWHAKCPICGQQARVPSTAMGKEITGYCDSCKRPMDDHIFGRLSYACPPGGKR